jgi:hypothetical protein
MAARDAIFAKNFNSLLLQAAQSALAGFWYGAHGTAVYLKR